MRQYNTFLPALFIISAFTSNLYTRDTTSDDLALVLKEIRDLNKTISDSQKAITTHIQSLGSHPISVNPNIHVTAHSSTSTQFLLQQCLSQVQNASSYIYNNIPTLTQAQDFMYINRTYLTGGAAVSAYITLSGYLQYEYYTVFGNQAWIYWCNHLTLAELVSASTTSLTQKLLQDIHMRYFNKENVQDVIIPYARFIYEIDKQIAAANCYMQWHNSLSYCYAATAFGLTQTRYERIKEAKTRLCFIKNIFMSWISEQSLVSNKKS